mmetsp:Transcript_14029/g.38444  ORF Transcript_14029/g.38444 Transcript_14029/m.38444 type:complete len:227 (+) Transcript_14029:626-1306(+)
MSYSFGMRCAFVTELSRVRKWRWRFSGGANGSMVIRILPRSSLSSTFPPSISTPPPPPIPVSSSVISSRASDAARHARVTNAGTFTSHARCSPLCVSRHPGHRNPRSALITGSGNASSLHPQILAAWTRQCARYCAGTVLSSDHCGDLYLPSWDPARRLFGCRMPRSLLRMRRLFGAFLLRRKSSRAWARCSLPGGGAMTMSSSSGLTSSMGSSFTNALPRFGAIA